jgi:hypothetical protein
VPPGDKELARDQRELHEFKTLLAALDDALMRNHLETYYQLNSRLRTLMDREFEQTRDRLAQATAEVAQSRRAMRGERMKAGMGGTSSDFLQLQDQQRDLRDDRYDLAGAKKRRDEMHTLIKRFDALQYGIQQEESRSYARNAALLDNFLKLMRAESAAAKAERSRD